MNKDKQLSKLLFASHNRGKIAEIRHLLAPQKVTVYSAAELVLPDPEETGINFYQNAVLKAKAAAQFTKLPVLADDSGLCVSALGGAPGIYSARWAETATGKRDFSAAMSRVEKETKLLPQPLAACFICALVLLFPDGKEHHFCGKLEGNLSFPARGNHGFGYDPIFIPNGHEKTLAEIEFAEKQQLSHRWRALQQLRLFLFAAAEN